MTDYRWSLTDNRCIRSHLFTAETRPEVVNEGGENLKTCFAIDVCRRPEPRGAVVLQEQINTRTGCGRCIQGYRDLGILGCNRALNRGTKVSGSSAYNYERRDVYLEFPGQGCSHRVRRSGRLTVAISGKPSLGWAFRANFVEQALGKRHATHKKKPGAEEEEKRKGEKNLNNNTKIHYTDKIQPCSKF